MMTEKAKPPGQKVLVVEDEWLLASSLAAELSSVQLEPVGPAATEKKALDLIEQYDPDAAILDGNLGGEFAYGVAHELRARGIPFLFLTGYSRSELPDDIGDVTILEKPCEDKQVVA